jgi:hypothetical protein
MTFTIPPPQHNPQSHHPSETYQFPSPPHPSLAATSSPPLPQKELSIKYRIIITVICIILCISIGLNVYFLHAKPSDQESLNHQKQIENLQRELSEAELEIRAKETEIRLTAKELEIRRANVQDETTLLHKQTELANAVNDFSILKQEKNKIEKELESTKLELKKVTNENDQKQSKLDNFEKSFSLAYFDQKYLEFYNDPDPSKMEKLNEIFIHLKALFPDEFYPAESAEALFCENMEHFYLSGLFSNNILYTLAAKNMLKFCPMSRVLIDLPKGLVDHIKTYVTRGFIFVDDRTDHIIDLGRKKSQKHPFFLKECLSFYNMLTGKDVHLKRFGVPPNNSPRKVYKFPKLPISVQTDFTSAQALILKISTPNDFLDYSTRNYIRRSLEHLRGLPSLQMPLANNLKFLSWFYRTNLNDGGPIPIFLMVCNQFFHYMDSHLKLDPQAFSQKLDTVKNNVPRGLPPNDQEIIDMIKELLPPFDQPVDTLNMRNYQKKFWSMLIAQHNEALYEFLPTEIRDSQLKNAKSLLSTLLSAITALREGTLPEDDPYYNILSYNSESNNFLILGCLHSRAKFHGSTAEDWDTFVKKHFVIPDSSE